MWAIVTDLESACPGDIVHTGGALVSLIVSRSDKRDMYTIELRDHERMTWTHYPRGFLTGSWLTISRWSA